MNADEPGGTPAPKLKRMKANRRWKRAEARGRGGLHVKQPGKDQIQQTPVLVMKPGPW